MSNYPPLLSLVLLLGELWYLCILSFTSEQKDDFLNKTKKKKGMKKNKGKLFPKAEFVSSEGLVITIIMLCNLTHLCWVWQCKSERESVLAVSTSHYFCHFRSFRQLGIIRRERKLHSRGRQTALYIKDLAHEEKEEKEPHSGSEIYLSLGK